MGLELQALEEFWPITPVRTHAIARKGLSSQQQNEEEEEDDCHTPTSPSQTLRTPLECPPAPKKPRRVTVAAPRSVVMAPPPSQNFFQVPRDLASVFLPALPRRSSKQALNQMITVIHS
ncbi:LOW QUALITY PROTEIN: cyclin-dependent protein kinase inhibitor SMR15-like [Neltuma alba]|uniref:LOW QUALITY PROTEIN: cyclin-dependent protein kinase inhibitor SMR15-like n=1 Tax=Neltuma alba TaxID=207710 RepID=UPI0010A4C371|nr:LOW QUALITY PROTEIN: cyclin-dependent protein kinase inhibitor SMR15-like [Prosopis alba]